MNINSTVKTVLITGSQGYLGSEIVSQMKSIKNIRIVKTGREKGDYLCDLTNLKNTRQLLIDKNPDLIIHCAASVPKNIKDYDKDSTDSLIMVENLLKTSNSPIVFISSMTVYGENVINPVCESSIENPESKYALSKWNSEQLIKKHKRKSLIIRIPGLFGLPRTDGLVANIITSLKNDKMPEMPNKPLLWAAMHVKDAADSIIKLSLSEWHGLIKVNVGYSDICSISRVFEILNKTCKTNFIYKVKHPNFQFNLSVYQSLIGLQKHTIKGGLKQFGEELSQV